MGNLGMRGGLEYDAFTGWRRLLHWHRGQLKKVKRAFNKRMRRQARVLLHRGLQGDGLPAHSSGEKAAE